MKIITSLFINFLLVKFTFSLYYLDRRGPESSARTDTRYQRYNVPGHQPPFQVIDRNIHKRRLDVWVPLDDNEENPQTSTTTKAPKQVISRHVPVYNKVAPVYQRPPISKSKTSVIKHIKSSIPTPVYNRNDKPQRRSDNFQQHQFTDILNHLENYKKDDNYKPNQIQPKSPITKQAPKTKPKTNLATPSDKYLALKETTEAPQYQKRTPINIFPKVERSDVINVLQSITTTQKLVGKAMEPLAQLFRSIANSFSLDLTRRQSVEEVLETDRQDNTPIIDAIFDPINELIENLTENPEPPLIIATVLLSLVTGKYVGNTITETARVLAENGNENGNAMNDTANATQIMEYNNNNCPTGYELVYLGPDGTVYALAGNGMDADMGNDIGMGTGMGNGFVVVDRKSVV